MSPLIIILLILILSIDPARQLTAKKYKNENVIKKFAPTNYQNSPHLDRVNYVRIDGEKNTTNLSQTRATELRQDLQHLLATMAKKIIQRNRYDQTYNATDGRIVDKKFGKKISNDIMNFGKFSNDGERETEEKRDNVNFDGRRGVNGAKEKLSKDLLEISEAFFPTVRKIVERSRLSENRDYEKNPIKGGINRDNGRKMARTSSRVKRENNATNETIEPNQARAWMQRDFNDRKGNLKMHAFIVKDEEIPPCCSTAKTVTDRRYFMCSGAVLTAKHAITTASCMHLADIYERKVEADLAVLVGATGLRSYVIKINRYEMHPDYDYNVHSRTHALHNLAILYLACSVVPQDVVVPSLPRGVNDDVAHMCCREGCELITIMESIDNRNTAHIVQAKNLPAPKHSQTGEEIDNDDDEYDYDEHSPQFRRSFKNVQKPPRRFRKPILFNDTRSLIRRYRSPLRLAAAPTFFGDDSRRSSAIHSSAKSSESTITKKRKKSKTSQTSRAKNQQRDRTRKKLNFDDLIDRGGRPGRAHIPIMRALREQGINVDEQLAAIDWEKVEETVEKKFSSNNRAQIDAFATNIVDETMRRLENVLDDEDGVGVGAVATKGNVSSVFENLMPNRNRNKTVENFVHVFTKVVSSIVTPNNGGTFAVSSDTFFDEKDLKDPPPANQECPPVGTPVFAEGVLVGLIAYTCNDVQTWVAWKYVNIAKNILWIRKQMVTDYGYVGLCAGPEMPVPSHRRSAGDERIANVVKKPSMETETEIFDGKVGWTRREATNDVHRSISTGNPVNPARILGTGMHPRIPKDSWFVGNSPVAPQFSQRGAQHQPWIFANSRDQPRQSSANDAPVYNVNTCYVKPDGSTDCQTRGDVDIR